MNSHVSKLTHQTTTSRSYIPNPDDKQYLGRMNVSLDSCFVNSSLIVSLFSLCYATIFTVIASWHRPDFLIVFASYKTPLFCIGTAIVWKANCHLKFASSLSHSLIWSIQSATFYYLMSIPSNRFYEFINSF